MVAGLTAALAAALVAGTAASTILAVKATRSASRASAEAQRADQEARTATERAEAAALAQSVAEKAQKKEEQAHCATEAARQTAREHARIADEQRKLALNTLSTLVFRVQAQLHDTPDTQQLKQSLLETALKGLEAVAKESSESAVVDMNMAEAHRQMGDLYQVLGRIPDARDQYEKMLAVTNRAHGRGPGSRPGRPQQVRRPRPRRRRKPAPRRHSQGPSLLTWTPSIFGRRWSRPTRPTPSGKWTWPRSSPSWATPVLRTRPGRTTQRLSPCARTWRLGRWTRTSPPASAMSGTPRFKLLELALRTGDLASARKHGTECSKIAEDLVKRTKTRSAQLDLAASYGKLGQVARREGRHAQADKLLAAAWQNIKPNAEKDPQNLSLQSDYALALAHAGRHAATLERASWLRERVGKNPNYLYNIACCYALSAGAVAAGPAAVAGGVGAAVRPAVRGESTDLAISALREAVANGFRDRELIAADPDLDPVRGHPAFAGVADGIRPAGGK